MVAVPRAVAEHAPPLVPAKAGTQSLALDSRLRGNEREGDYRCCTGACCGSGAFDACAGGEPGSTTTRLPTCTRL
jgi:hypothetical protein